MGDKKHAIAEKKKKKTEEKNTIYTDIEAFGDITMMMQRVISSKKAEKTCPLALFLLCI